MLDYAAQARAAGLADQYALLRDGDATRSDYETQVDVSLACHRAKGREPYTPWINPVNGIQILYDLPPGEGIPLNESLAGQDCETAHLGFVEGAYVDTHPRVMAESLRAYVAGCLAVGGVELSGAESNLDQFLTSAGEARKDLVISCVEDGLHLIYPDQPEYFVSY